MRGTSRRLDVPIWVHEKLGAVELDQRATGQTLGADLMVDGGIGIAQGLRRPRME